MLTRPHTKKKEKKNIPMDRHRPNATIKPGTCWRCAVLDLRIIASAQKIIFYFFYNRVYYENDASRGIKVTLAMSVTVIMFVMDIQKHAKLQRKIVSFYLILLFKTFRLNRQSMFAVFAIVSTECTHYNIYGALIFSHCLSASRRLNNFTLSSRKEWNHCWFVYFLRYTF